MIFSILALITYSAICMLTFHNFTLNRRLRKTLIDLAYEQLRMQKILNIFMMTSQDIIVNNVVLKLIKMSPEEVKDIDLKKLYNTCAVESLQGIKTKIKNQVDEFEAASPGNDSPLQKGLEDIIILISTVDENSSPEYIRQIFMEITVGLNNMAE